MRSEPAGISWNQATWVTLALGGFAVAGGVAALLGWGLDFPRLAAWVPNGIAMQPNTAVAMILMGAAVVSLPFGHRGLLAILGLLPALLGAATLFEHASGVELGIDQLLLLEREWGQRGTRAPGRMGLPAATSFTILGTAIVLAAFGYEGRKAAVWGGALTIGIATLSVLGYLFGADNLYSVPNLTAIALPTATLLLTVGVGLVTAFPEVQPLKTLSEDSAAGALVRRALPSVILLPIVLGWLCVRGVDLGLFDSAFGTSLMVLFLLFMLTALLWWATAAVRVHEQALRESRTNLEGLLASVSDGFQTVDREWRYTFFNAATRRLLAEQKYDADAMLGKPMFEVFPDLRAMPAGRALMNAMEKRIDLEYETYYEPWQRWFAVRCSPSPDGGLIILSQDITRRKQAEERLRASEARMQLAMSIADAATWDADLVSGEIHWSESHFSMFRLKTTPNRPATLDMWQTAVVPEDRVRILAEWQRAERERDMFVSEHRIRRADNGRIVWVSAAGRFFYDEVGKAVRFVGVLFDITARKGSAEELRRLAADLRDADRRKDEFLATLAHELRNPLAPIRNSLAVLKRAGDDTALIEQARSTMERQVGQMVRLIDDLLDVSRISRDRLELRRQTVDLAAVIEQAAEACGALLESAQHELTIALPPQPTHLDGDPARLAQVFGNLLANACKYTMPGGRIRLTAERQGRDLVVSVKDTGIGIAPDMLPKVFEMFAQVDQTLDWSQGGLGIGLALARRLVELHGGTLTAHSAGQGLGSEFVVRLPILIDMPKPEPTPDPIADPTIARRVLVVDDNRDAAESLALLLEMCGNETQMAHDGVEALDKAAAYKPDLILLDIGLPKLNGYDVCRAIRAQPWGRDVVLVALTGWGQESDRRKSDEAGFDAHLVKPVDDAALMKLLATSFRGVVDSQLSCCK